MSATNRGVERLRQPDDFPKIFALATETVVVLVTALVVSRRLSGSLDGPIEAGITCLVATLAAALSLAALAFWTTAAQSSTSLRKRILTASTATLSPLALCAALWISPSGFVGGYLIALATACVTCAVAIEDWARGFLLTNWLRSTLSQSAAPPAASEACQLLTASGVTTAMPTEISAAELFEPGESELVADEEVESDPSIVQWMTRRRLPDGGEVVEGAVRIDLEPSESVGVAHLAFSPPLRCDPRAECHLLCDFDGRVRITTAKSYGLRIEARQSGERALATTINVAFSAQSPPAATHAAAA
jgi:hypothetical protein